MVDAGENIVTIELSSKDIDVIHEKILGGEYGFMCQYDRKKNVDTVWSVIYDLTEKRIFRVEGKPIKKSFKEDFRFKFK